MPEVATHYHKPGLASQLVEAVRRHQGCQPNIDDLAPIDELHLRGRDATIELAALVGVGPGNQVLDLGCGVGGPARKLAATTGCNVVGIDLTPDYVEAANSLTELVGMQDRVRFQVADALALPFGAGSFDVVWTQHVAMNIEDKSGLYREVHRVLRPQGKLALYDIMAGEGAVQFPVPWASSAEQSFLVGPKEVRTLIEDAGFDILEWDDVTSRSQDWLEGMLRKANVRRPLGLHLVMGDRILTMLENVLLNLREERISVTMASAVRS